MGKAWSALSDGTRRRILSLLHSKDMTAGEIAEHFDISKPSISHHLNVLKEAEVVSCEKKGQNVIYSINTTVLQDIMGFFMGLLKEENDDEKKL